MISSVDPYKSQTDSASYVCIIAKTIQRGLTAMLFTVRVLHQQGLLTSLARGYKLRPTPISIQVSYVLGNRSVLGTVYAPGSFSSYKKISYSICQQISWIQTDLLCLPHSKSKTASFKRFENFNSFHVRTDRKETLASVYAISQSEMPKRKRTHSEPSKKKKRPQSEVSKRKKRSHSETSKQKARSEYSKRKSPRLQQHPAKEPHFRSSRSRRNLEDVMDDAKDRGGQFGKSENQKAIEGVVRRMRRQSKGTPATQDGTTSPIKSRRTAKSVKENAQEKHSHHSQRTFPPPPGCSGSTKMQSSSTPYPASIDQNRQQSHIPPPGQCGFTQRDFSTYAPVMIQKHSRPSTPPPGWSEFAKSGFSSATSALGGAKKQDGQSSNKAASQDGQSSNKAASREFDRPKQMHHRQGWRRRELHEFRRHWRDTSLGRRHKASPYAGVDFTVVSYNVLAQQLINMNDYLYQGCSGRILDWEYRKKNLLLEIKDINADIFCLQEVQGTHFTSFYEPEMRNLGYSGVFKQRTGDKQDGCATFFKNSRFDMVECKRLEYRRPGIQLLDRDNVAVIVVLQPKGMGISERVCVANTHLLYNPKRGDIKLTQLSILLAEIDRLSYMGCSHQNSPGASSESHRYHPVIMCGDFNSVPQSRLVEFVQRGSLAYEGLRAVDVSGQEPHRHTKYLSAPLWPAHVGVTYGCQYNGVLQQRQLGSKNNSSSTESSGEPSQPLDATKENNHSFSNHLKHPFQFSSSYVYNEDSKEVTTNHGRTNCTVDYIFHSSGTVPNKKDTKQLRILSRLSLFTNEEAAEMGGLPNSRWSSDHYSLAVKFLLVSHDGGEQK